MSTSSVSSTSNQGVLSTSTSASTGTQLLQITGLATNLDTNSIISAMLAAQRAPITALGNQQTGLTAKNTQLTNLQTVFQQVALDAQALGSAALFANAQTVSSSDATRVSATMGSGAGVGGYQVDVSQLANSAQRTFTYASPTANDQISIDNQNVTVTAGESISDFVQSVNSNSNLDVYAAATDSGTVILSGRTTGAPPANGSFITVADSGGALTEQAGLARAGQDAKYTIDGGTQQTSSSNTVTNAIGGVSLNFNGVTTTSGPVTVNVSPPAPSTSGILSAVQTFVNAYNAAINQTNTQLSQVPSSSDPTQGTLYEDDGLSGLLGTMRTAMYTPDTTLTSGLQSLSDIGISTGAASGSTPYSQDAVAGKLTIDTTKLTAAITSNPTGVLNLLSSWSQSFASSVNAEAGPGGTIESRINDDNSQSASIGNEITDLTAALTARQTALQAQFAQLEVAISQNQTQGTWLASQTASLSANGLA
jgi:flagellar hook-associated protein 2